MMPHTMLSRLLLLALLAGANAGAAIAAAATGTPAPAITLTEGVEYERLATPEPTRNPTKIEVLEVFNYGCVHCFELEAALRTWKARQPTDIDLRFLPATFRPEFELYARGFFAAEALGQLDATHARMFDAVWKEHVPIHSLGDLASLYARLGVDRARFIQAAQSAENRAAVDASKEQVRRLKVDGTPSIYVAGRYHILATLITSQEELLQRVDAVIAMERAARKLRR
jgi:thiol:disulfide interchange protein DsbA